MDILSEEEVSYYKKSLISQEGSIKKGAPGDAPVVAKSAPKQISEETMGIL